MKLQRNKMQIFICASEALAQEEHDRYMAQRNAVKLHGLPGGLVLFEEIGRIKESAGSIDASYLGILTMHLGIMKLFSIFQEESFPLLTINGLANLLN